MTDPFSCSENGSFFVAFPSSVRNAEGGRREGEARIRRADAWARRRKALTSFMKRSRFFRQHFIRRRDLPPERSICIQAIYFP